MASECAQIRVLGGIAIDTIEVLSAGVVRPDVRVELESLWRRAHSGERIESWSGALGPSLSVRVAGRGSQYPLMLCGPWWRMQLCPWRGHARFIVGADFLRVATLAEVTLEIERAHDAYYATQDDDGRPIARKRYEVSRLDLAADFVGLNMERFVDKGSCVTRARAIQPWWEAPEAYRTRLEARGPTSVTAGSAGSRVQACIYRKDIEARDKPVSLASLMARGWDGEAPVVRVEGRIRGRGLDDFRELETLMGCSLREVASLGRASEWVPALWRYLTERYMRWVVPGDDDHRERWRTREDWEAVQRVAVASPAPRRREMLAVAREDRRRRAAQAIVRGVVRAVAESESSYREAMAMMQTAERPFLALVAVACAMHGDLLERAALRTTERDDTMTELRARLRERRAFVEWCEEPALGLERENERVARMVA